EGEVAAWLPRRAEGAGEGGVVARLRCHAKRLVRGHVERPGIEAEDGVEGERRQHELLGDLDGAAEGGGAGDERLLRERLVLLPQPAHAHRPEDPPEGEEVEARVGGGGGEAERERGRLLVLLALMVLSPLAVVVSELAAAVLLERCDHLQPTPAQENVGAAG